MMVTDDSGAFLSDEAIWKDKLRDHAVGNENEDKLWSLSERLIGEKFNLDAN
jgi:hypothetical protein